MYRRRLAALAFVPLLLGQQCLEPIPNPADGQPPSPDSPRVTLHTNRGDIVIELFTQQGEAARNFQRYVEEGYYDDAIFHVVQSGQWIMGGTYTVTLALKESRPLIDESDNGLTNFRGRVAIRNPSDDGDPSPAEILINLTTNPSLDYDGVTPADSTVIGRVVEGMDVVDEIAELDTISQTAQDGNTLSNLPAGPVSMNNATLDREEYPSDEEDEDEDEPVFDLRAAMQYAAGDSPSAVAIADVDDDNHADLIVANRGSGTVSILLNQGDGTFDSPADYEVGTSPASVIVDDFDDDNAPDLAVANADSDSVSILLNQGDGTFEAGSSFSTGTNPVAVAAADFNNDNFLDLAVANSGSNNVTTALGNGDGTFSFVTTVGIVPTPEETEGEEPFEPTEAESPSAIAAADLDGDGDVDLVVANADSNNASVLLNDGTGVFTAEAAWELGSNPSGITAEDLDGRNRVDLAACDGTPDSDVIVRLNTGSGQFTLSDTFGVGSNPSGIAAGQLDSDNRTDLVTANAGSDNISVLINKGTGSFEDAQSFPAGTSPTAVALGDLDGDGDLDVAVATADGVAVLLNTLIEPADEDGDGDEDEDEDFITTASGLKYRDVVVGTGELVTPDMTIAVLYTGRLTDETGEIFDQSTDRDNPAEFSLSGLIQGWQEGLGGYDMRVGGTRILIIPPELGYGDQERTGIPANSTLYFDIEVLAVVP